MFKLLALAALLLSLPPGLSAQPAQSPTPASHQHETSSAHGTVLVPAARWAPDAPLRKGMRRVHVALDELQRYPDEDPNRAAALQHVTAIKDAVAFMFANCKLPPQPDQALHSILVPLLTAAQKFEDDPADLTQIRIMREAVATYPRYFDDRLPVTNPP